MSESILSDAEMRLITRFLYYLVFFIFMDWRVIWSLAIIFLVVVVLLLWFGVFHYFKKYDKLRKRSKKAVNKETQGIIIGVSVGVIVLVFDIYWCDKGIKIC